jgi:hypothetical protein
MTEPISGRYRPVAPLPTLGGVERELAVDQVADHRVAMARIAGGEQAAAVERALEAIKATRHASLAPVLDVFRLVDDTVVQIEAQADGPLLSSGVLLPQASALLVTADVADALATLHAAGQTHGGLVADAVVLDASGRPVVMGAGLARAVAIATGALAPTASSDVRALGAMLYLLVTGREPAQPPASPASFAPEIAPALNGLMLALLSDDPRRPPPPAALVAERLRVMAGVELPLDLMPAPALSPPLPTTPRRGISDAALAVIVGAIALLAIVLAAAAINGGDLFASDSPADTADDKRIPTFTLPQPDSLMLTVTDEMLPLPGVVTDTVPVETFEVFTDVTETFEVYTDVTETIPADTGTLTPPEATLQFD